MPDAALLGLVVDRIDSNPPAGGAADLILAAFQGAEPGDAALRGEPGSAPTSRAPGAAPGGVYLTAIEVEGFRGIGPPTTLAIEPGPGLTLVVGRNGSGKSSFSEALEMVLLGTNQRWEQRVKVWRDGLAEPAPPAHPGGRALRRGRAASSRSTWPASGRTATGSTPRR